MRPLKNIFILDTGKEWGGGTNSLIELLKRMDRTRYGFSAIFYNNYKMGDGSDIKTEMEKLDVEFILLKQSNKGFLVKVLKEAWRLLLFLSSGLKKRYIFSIDYKYRILPDSKKIAEVLKKYGADLLYMNNQPSSNLEGILAARDLNLNCIQHSRIEVSLNPFEADVVNKWVSKVICVSKGVMNGLVRSGVRSEKCITVYNGIDVQVKPKREAKDMRDALGIEGGSFVIGTVGSLIKRKRIDLLLDAVALLKEMERRVYCLIVGAGPEMERLNREAARLGIDDRVFFTGFSTDAVSYINSMDLFILTSEKEGLPRVILEAMLMGKPVVAFDITGPGELVMNNETGILLKGEPPQSITGAVKRLMEDRELMQNMGEAGRKRVVNEFNIERYTAGVSRVFEEVLS